MRTVPYLSAVGTNRRWHSSRGGALSHNYQINKEKDMKHIMVGLTLFLLVTSAWAGTFKDNFDDGNMNGWTEVGTGGTWKIENGELVIRIFGGTFGFGIGESTWRDYTVGVRLKLVKHLADPLWIEVASLALRFAGFPLGYGVGLGTFGATPKQLQVWYISPQGQGYNVKSVPFEWNLDTWYDLKAVVEGDQFKYYVNDKLILETTDNTFPTGYVGIGVVGISVIAHFDDFSVTGDDIPDNLVAVSSKAKLATTWGQIKRF